MQRRRPASPGGTRPRCSSPSTTSPIGTGSSLRRSTSAVRSPSSAARLRGLARVTAPALTSHTAAASRGHVGLVGDADHDLAAARAQRARPRVAASGVERAVGIVHEQERRLADLRARPPSASAEPQAEGRRPGLPVASRAERAPRSRTASSRSSRWGPTSEVRRWSSSARRSPSRRPERRGRRPRRRLDVRRVAHRRDRSPRAGGTRRSAAAQATRLGAAGACRRSAPAPASTSCSSHASSPAGAPRPSHSFSRRFRWRTTLARRRSRACPAPGCSATTTSSMNARRFDGSPITTGRSNGPNSTARTCRRRSRRRRTGERFTWIRFAPRRAHLDLDEHVPVAGRELAADVAGLGAVAHHRLGRGRARAARARTGRASPRAGWSCPRRWDRPPPRARRGSDRAACARGCGSRAARPT